MMLVWKGRESLLRDLLILHGDGLELQSTNGRRPLPRTLDTRELVRVVIIEQKRFTVRLLHADIWIPAMQNRIKTSELTLLCTINNNIQEINKWFVQFSVSAVNVAGRHALDLHSKLKTTSWNHMQYSSLGKQDDTTGEHKKVAKRGERGTGQAQPSRGQEQATSSRRVSGVGQDCPNVSFPTRAPLALLVGSACEAMEYWFCLCITSHGTK